MDPLTTSDAVHGLLLAAVDQSGLQSQGHYVAGDEHHIGLDRAVRGLTCEVIDLGFVPERVPQRVLQPFCNVKRGEYGLDNVCILYRSKTPPKRIMAAAWALIAAGESPSKAANSLLTSSRRAKIYLLQSRSSQCFRRFVPLSAVTRSEAIGFL